MGGGAEVAATCEGEGMDAAATIEAVLASVLKPRGYRKRARNWFRTTSADEYQVINLQKSPWGGGSCYLNLGWDPTVPPGGFLAGDSCCLSMRAEQTDVIPTFEWVRPDGQGTLELDGISLLDTDCSKTMSEAYFVEQVTVTIAVPVADLMDRTPALIDTAPLVMAKPWLAFLDTRAQFLSRGIEIP